MGIEIKTFGGMLIPAAQTGSLRHCLQCGAQLHFVRHEAILRVAISMPQALCDWPH